MVDEKLKQIYDKYTNIKNQQQKLNEDEKSILDEAKSMGFNNKIIKKLYKLANSDKEQLLEEKLLLETYSNSLDIQLEFVF